MFFPDALECYAKKRQRTCFNPRYHLPGSITAAIQDGLLQLETYKGCVFTATRTCSFHLKWTSIHWTGLHWF